MKLCKCGTPVGLHVRFHRAPPFEEPEGHYTEDRKPAPVTRRHELEAVQIDLELLPVNLQRAWPFFGSPPFRAPAPTVPIPAKPWGLESDIRRSGIDQLRRFGYAVYDLEQGFREDGSTRVGEGIGDAYFHGHGRRGWLEFKRWDNEPSGKQIAFGKEELEAGGIYLLIYETRQLVEWQQSVSSR